MSGKQEELCMSGECMDCSPGDEPLTLKRCHSFMKPWKGGNSSVAKPKTSEHKGENFFFHIFELY